MPSLKKEILIKDLHILFRFFEVSVQSNHWLSISDISEVQNDLLLGRFSPDYIMPFLISAACVLRQDFVITPSSIKDVAERC